MFEKKQQMIVSFYSYKGGVGRTQFCANMAAYLCFYKHRKVLLWDWDLEAPGLHSYFGLKEENINTPGTLELMEDHLRSMREKQVIQAEEVNTLEEKNIIHIDETTAGGKIDLIPAGNYSEDYSMRLNNFSWSEFLHDSDGVMFFNIVKEHLLNFDYQYVLVDGRTGTSHYAGICNVLLPDVNVLVIGPNNQNFFGSKSIADKIVNHPYVKEKYRRGLILPILSRLDKNSLSLKDWKIWTERFYKTFGFLLTELMPDKVGSSNKVSNNTFIQFLDNTLLPYNHTVSTGENILFKKKDKAIINTLMDLAQNYAKIGEYLEGLKEFGKIRFLSPTTALEPATLEFNSVFEKAKQHLEKAKNLPEFIKKRKEAFEEAILLFEESVAYYPSSFEGWFYLGEAYLMQNNFPKALISFEKALEINANSAEVWYKVGKCKFELERPDEGEDAIIQARHLEPNTDNWTYLHGEILLQNGKESSGIKILNMLQGKLYEDKERRVENLEYFLDNPEAKSE